MDKKKRFFKNRIKIFYAQPKKHGRNRLKEIEGSLSSDGNSEEITHKNPEEEQDDFS